jgi:tRNA (mo5U34)-methyltransferase
VAERLRDSLPDASDRAAGSVADRVAAARAAIDENPVWYHTLELAPGAVTPGHVDLRRVAAKVLPDDLSGKRALDVGTFDGFWAFELEQRGAEVVAIDVESVDAGQLIPIKRERIERVTHELDIQLGRGFRIACELLGSRARRVVCDVVDLTPEAIGGPVDVAFMGALLVHLRDPVAALERVRESLVPGGELYQLEPISLWLSMLHPRRPVAHLQTLETDFNWWLANRAALSAWLRTAGFIDVRRLGIHRPPERKPMRNWYQAIGSHTLA